MRKVIGLAEKVRAKVGGATFEPAALRCVRVCVRVRWYEGLQVGANVPVVT